MITTSDIEHKLNYLYAHGSVEYSEHLETVKELGYRVFRNSKGEHKIQLGSDYLKEAFGGVFGNLFGGN